MAANPNPLAFYKYHGLGNDYLVVEPQATGPAITPALARFICDRHYGAGSDGLLVGPLGSAQAEFGLLIYNPDGSQAEKSGNGLRIFSRYLFDTGRVQEQPFTVETLGGLVTCQVLSAGQAVQVGMDLANFDSHLIPMTGPPRQVIDEILRIGERKVRICALTLGNPHCVVLNQAVDPVNAGVLGPLIENHPNFPQRTNVQFLEVLDRSNLRIEIWERGVGYTLASGTSACAAASAAHALGWGLPHVTVHMPGGQLQVAIDPASGLILTGPVAPVYSGLLNLDGFQSYQARNFDRQELET